MLHFKHVLFGIDKELLPSLLCKIFGYPDRDIRAFYYGDLAGILPINWFQMSQEKRDSIWLTSEMKEKIKIANRNYKIHMAKVGYYLKQIEESDLVKENKIKFTRFKIKNDNV